MQVIWMVLFILVAFTIGYIGYSRYLTSLTELDDDRETPAHKYRDGQEYVPSEKPVLLGHHYSSIAGGGPIAGPITAVAAFGWLPALLWIAIGNPIFGAVHDFMALVSSARHEGKSIGYIIGEYVGEQGKNMLLWFAFLLVILVIAAFIFLVATVFNAYPAAATASMIYIGLALLFGVYLYQLQLPFWPGAIAFTAGVFAGVWVGLQYPIAMADTGLLPEGTIVLLGDAAAWEWLPLAAETNPNAALWAIVVMLYCFAAAVLPVWVLLQPRDFLTSTLLYVGIGAMLLGAIVGSIIGFESVEISIAAAGIESVQVDRLVAEVPAYTGFVHPELGWLFPFLFVTIACGAISGFHSLVSSGTTAKQLDKESDARLIGYGGMLGEGLLAVTAILAVVIIAATTEGLMEAIATFPAGGGALISALGISAMVGVIFVALVFVSFLLTSTDTAARLGRYMIEELVGTPESTTQELAANRYVNSAVCAFGGYLLVASGTWGDIWPLFGGANQLLASLALLVATVWLANVDDSKQLLTTGAPMVFMVSVTVIALAVIGLWRNPQAILADPTLTYANVARALQSIIAVVLLVLAVALLYLGLHNIRDARAGLGTDAITPGSDDD
ncbi:carbon starvation protein A [Natronococcus pandeyae]|uniref:Carbon starvation protein A n=1 Tax=Natronococcus pandeyae TaxID=2055836 RepID=A0A8J8Q6S0_9EURY|nr:carbon starvation protein A [Natronococcus pandeyae]TYL39643.1 carbon starvation protein A [Natronococcus pandeyae]